ncbi:unnamed protein product [Brassica oleracea]
MKHENMNLMRICCTDPEVVDSLCCLHVFTLMKSEKQ